jgi:hypothetical protein
MLQREEREEREEREKEQLAAGQELQGTGRSGF